MIITPDILRRDTIQLLKQIDLQINQVQREAARVGVEPHQLRESPNGSWSMTPLLLAKAQAYATLVQLQTMK
jgi:hypothetical protein